MGCAETDTGYGARPLDQARRPGCGRLPRVPAHDTGPQCGNGDEDRLPQSPPIVRGKRAERPSPDQKPPNLRVRGFPCPGRDIVCVLVGTLCGELIRAGHVACLFDASKGFTLRLQ